MVSFGWLLFFIASMKIQAFIKPNWSNIKYIQVNKFIWWLCFYTWCCPGFLWQGIHKQSPWRYRENHPTQGSHARTGKHTWDHFSLTTQLFSIFCKTHLRDKQLYRFTSWAWAWPSMRNWCIQKCVPCTRNSLISSRWWGAVCVMWELSSVSYQFIHL